MSVSKWILLGIAVIALGVLGVSFRHSEPVTQTDQTVSDIPLKELNCRVQLPEHKGAIGSRYQASDNTCYFQYKDPNFWKGEDCSKYVPSGEVTDAVVRQAMEHNAELCQAGLYELR